jgi:hypothetical protein
VIIIYSLSSLKLPIFPLTSNIQRTWRPWRTWRLIKKVLFGWEKNIY